MLLTKRSGARGYGARPDKEETAGIWLRQLWVEAKISTSTKKPKLIAFLIWLFLLLRSHARSPRTRTLCCPSACTLALSCLPSPSLTHILFLSDSFALPRCPALCHVLSLFPSCVCVRSRKTCNLSRSLFLFPILFFPLSLSRLRHF